MTKKQRKQMYMEAMFELVENIKYQKSYSGICLAMANADASWNVYREMKTKYPELYKTRPKKKYNDVYWFAPGKCLNKRLQCLARAIYLCN